MHRRHGGARAWRSPRGSRHAGAPVLQRELAFTHAAMHVDWLQSQSRPARGQSVPVCLFCHLSISISHPACPKNHGDIRVKQNMSTCIGATPLPCTDEQRRCHAEMRPSDGTTVLPSRPSIDWGQKNRIASVSVARPCTTGGARVTIVDRRPVLLSHRRLDRRRRPVPCAGLAL